MVLGRQLKFLVTIAENSLRHDIVIVWETLRQVVILELTVPLRRLDGGCQRRRAKNEELASKCQSKR